MATQKRFNWEKTRLRKDPIEKRQDWEKTRLRKDPIEKRQDWEKTRLRKDQIEKRQDWEKTRLRKDPIEKRSDWESLQMITTVNYNRRAGQSRWSNPGGENSELLYNVIAPMMADAELPSRVMQPQASSTSSGNLRRSFSWVNSPLKDCKKQSDSQVTIW